MNAEWDKEEEVGPKMNRQLIARVVSSVITCGNSTASTRIEEFFETKLKKKKVGWICFKDSSYTLHNLCVYMYGIRF